MGFSFFTDLITPTKFDVPSFPTIDPSQEQQNTITGNIAAFDKSKKLASDFNAYMRAQTQQALKQGIPGYENITRQMSGNIESGLRGELSLSDAAATQRQSAARSLGLGVAGSGVGGNLSVRDLGMRQYQVQQQAQANAGSYLGTMKSLTAAPMFDFSNVFLSPQQRIETAFRNASNQWNIQNLKNQMAVQPEPWMKATAGLGDSLVNAAASYFTMGGSGLMGGGGSSSGNSMAGPYNWQDEAAVLKYGLRG